MTKIRTKYRTIVSEIPQPDLLPLISEIRSFEPRSIQNSFPMYWDRAYGATVYDGGGNKWIDFTSSGMVANAGHANPDICEAIKAQIDWGLLHNFSDPFSLKLDYFRELRTVLPKYLDRICLLTTGSEAVECAVRIMREWGQTKDYHKINIISHEGSFHGLTMAARALFNSSKPHDPPGFYALPFLHPGYECDSFNIGSVETDSFIGAIVETFRGPSVTFMPIKYVWDLRKWTKEHDALLVFDEIQAGFGRTGKWFGFEHYGVEPDMIIVGKGMTSSLPMSAVIGRHEIIDSVISPLHSTHSGNPLCLAAAKKNLEVIRDEQLVENAERLGRVCRSTLESLRDKYPDYIGAINGRGLAMAFYLVGPNGNPDVILAIEVINECRRLGLLLLPTGQAGTIKIAPPLCIDCEALLEGIGVIDEAIGLCLAKKETRK